MSYFLQSGDTFAPTPGKESVLETLPVGNYIVIKTMQGMMFKRVDRFGDDGRMYGSVDTRAQRIFDTFQDRPRATGVLLSGEKGSGKSQLARRISRLGYESGIPTILVNAPFVGDEFNALLASIEQPAIVLMDEFEKVYGDQDDQEQILTLLDGVMTSQKLFLMTVNDKYKVNRHMKNRPGRLFYSIEFGGLETEFIREYCADNLNDVDKTDEIVKISGLFDAFNFDMLKAMVEEMNRYKESAFEVIEILNAKPDLGGSTEKYDVTVVTENGRVSEPAEVDQLPIAAEGRRGGGGVIGFHVAFVDAEGRSSRDVAKKRRNDADAPLAAWERELLGDLDSDGEEHIIVHAKDLTKMDVDRGRYEFVNEAGDTIVFTKRKAEKYDLRHIGSF